MSSAKTDLNYGIFTPVGFFVSPCICFQRNFKLTAIFSMTIKYNTYL